MRETWSDLPETAQNLGLLALLLLPLAVLAVALWRGFAPGPLVRALLWRFRWANAVYAVLIAVSTGLGVGILAQERGLRQGTAQAASKFDMVVAAPGSEMTAMLAAVFLQPSAIPLIDGATYAEIADHPRVVLAAPIAFGDSWEGRPVVGSTADFVTYLVDGEIEGRLFRTSAEAVAGALVPLSIGDRFVPAHGDGEAADAGAHDAEIEVVGRMPPTGSPWDNALIVPVESVWETHGLANGHPLSEGDRIGPPFSPRHFPGTPAILVKPDGFSAAYALRAEINARDDLMAFFPGAVLSDLYRVMGDVRQAMSLMTLVTQVLVALSVLLGLFILSRLFARQLALLRALGAPGRFVMAVVWGYGTVLTLIGAGAGLLVGLSAASVLSRIVTARTDIAITSSLGWTEVHLLAGFVSIVSILTLIPAVAVLRQPVVKGLRA